jgi:hypothetical protein
MWSGAGPGRCELTHPAVGLLPAYHPGWMNQLLGEQARETDATGVDVVQRFDTLPPTARSAKGCRWYG